MLNFFELNELIEEATMFHRTANKEGLKAPRASGKDLTNLGMLHDMLHDQGLDEKGHLDVKDVAYYLRYMARCLKRMQTSLLRIGSKVNTNQYQVPGMFTSKNDLRKIDRNHDLHHGANYYSSQLQTLIGTLNRAAKAMFVKYMNPGDEFVKVSHGIMYCIESFSDNGQYTNSRKLTNFLKKTVDYLTKVQDWTQNVIQRVERNQPTPVPPPPSVSPSFTGSNTEFFGNGGIDLTPYEGDPTQIT